MPGVTLHLLLAEQVLEHWRRQPGEAPFPPDDPTVVNAFRQGAFGPDLGYFPGGFRPLSDLAHCMRAGDLARRLVSTARTPLERGFASGWSTHVLADRWIHPHIGRAVGELVHGKRTRFVDGDSDPNTHVLVESGLDAVYARRHPGLRTLRLGGVFDDLSIGFLKPPTRGSTAQESWTGTCSSARTERRPGARPRGSPSRDSWPGAFPPSTSRREDPLDPERRTVESAPLWGVARGLWRFSAPYLHRPGSSARWTGCSRHSSRRFSTPSRPGWPASATRTSTLDDRSTKVPCTGGTSEHGTFWACRGRKEFRAREDRALHGHVPAYGQRGLAGAWPPRGSRLPPGTRGGGGHSAPGGHQSARRGMPSGDPERSRTLLSGAPGFHPVDGTPGHQPAGSIRAGPGPLRDGSVRGLGGPSLGPRPAGASGLFVLHELRRVCGRIRPGAVHTVDLGSPSTLPRGLARPLLPERRHA